MKKLKFSLLLLTFLLFVFTIMASNHAFTAGSAKAPREAKTEERAGLSSESSVYRQYLKGGAFEGFSPRDEIVSRRTMTAKHFRASDGKGMAVINSGSIHYTDGEGVLRDIDTQVKPSSTAEFAFENTTNNLRSYFSGEDPGSNGVRVESENGAITIAIDPSIAWTDEAGNTEIIENAGLSSPISDKDKVTYFKLLPSADNEFVVEYDKLKNNLILNRLPDGLIGKSGTLGYSEFIELPAGWSLSSQGQAITAEARIRGSLEVIDEQGRTVFTFPASEVYEWNPSGNIREARAESVQTYYFVKNEGRRIQLITEVPLSWLSASERAFPVVIDPSVDLTFEGFGNWRYSCSGCSCPACNPPIPPPPSYNPNSPPEPYNSYNHSGESSAGWLTWNVSSVQNQCISNVEISYGRAFCNPGINVVGVNYVPLTPADSTAFANALIDDSKRVGTLQFTGGNCGDLAVYKSLSGAPSVIKNGPNFTLSFATNEVPSSITFLVAANLRITYQDISVTPGSVPNTALGSSYSVQFGTTGGSGVTYSYTGQLPPGMSLSSSGALTASSVSQAGMFTFQIIANIPGLCSISRTYTIDVVNCASRTISVSPSTIPIGAPNSSYPATTFSGTGGTGPYTFSRTGALPSGMVFSGATLSGTPTQVGAFPVTISATDSYGCVGSRNYTLRVCQSIDVNPLTVPFGTVGVPYTPVTFTQTNAVGNATFSTASTLPTGITLSSAGELSGTPTQFGTFPITVTVTDQNGCTGTRSVSLFINRPPVATCQNVTVSAGPTCTASASINNGSLDPDGGAVTTSQSPPGPYPLGTTTVTLTVMDALGVSRECSATVTVVDDTPPSITCPANITQVAEPAKCTAVVNFTVNASDLCSGVTVVSNPPSGFAFPKGTTTVTATATDAAGNMANCTFTVTVNDTQPPAITCPSNLSVAQDKDLCTAVVTYQLPNVSDNCPGVGTPVCNPPSGSIFPLGTTTVACTVSDAAANSSGCSFMVTVNDTVAPVLSCPANIITSTAPDLCSAVVNYNVSATDNCSSLTVVSSPPSGSVFQKGTTTVTATATDAVGNMASCTFTVTVNDTQPPVITCPANITQVTDPGKCTAVVNYALPVVSDNCPGFGTPVCNPPSGSTFLKGITTVTATATDASGNTTSCTFTVTVNDTQPPAITCPSNLSVAQDKDQCTALVTYQLPNVSDNCSGVSIPVCNPPSGSIFPLGTTTVTCTVSDAATNSSNCSFTVTVNDTVAPVLNCPANIITSTAPDLCSAVVSYNVSATDNCSSVSVVSSPPSGSVFQKGTTTVTATATDAVGNRSTCTFTVTVNDTQPPSIVCPPSITLTNDPNQCSAVVNYALPMVSDNCPGVTIPVCNPPSGSIFLKGTTVVTCGVKDLSGIMSTCTFTVTVNDTQLPVITCPTDMILTAINPGDTTVIGSYPSPTVSDNCTVANVVCNPPSGSAFPIGVTVVTCSVTDTSSNVRSCTFTMSVYDVCLEDDSVSSKRLLFNSFTGDYLFNCGAATVRGKGTITRKGGDITLEHYLSNCRVSGKVSSSARSGTATLQYPLDTKCSIVDRNITNNSCGSNVRPGS
jgi:hypothetical protein